MRRLSRAQREVLGKLNRDGEELQCLSGEYFFKQRGDWVLTRLTVRALTRLGCVQESLLGDGTRVFRISDRGRTELIRQYQERVLAEGENDDTGGY